LCKSIYLILLCIVQLLSLLLHYELVHLSLLLLLKLFEVLSSLPLCFLFGLFLFSRLTCLALLFGLGCGDGGDYVVGATSILLGHVPLVNHLLDLILHVVHAKVHL